jgi:cytoskeleton protein RodZ
MRDCAQDFLSLKQPHELREHPMNEETQSTASSLTGRLTIDQTNFGSTLRDAREAKGLTLEMIADKLKLRTSLLSLLEAGELGQLPEAIFTRSYIQSYAKLVGLDAAPFVQVYDRVSGAAPAPAPSVPRATRINTPSPLSPIPVSGLAASGVNKSVSASGATSALGSNRPITMSSARPSSSGLPMVPIVLAGLVVLGAIAWVAWTALNKTPKLNSTQNSNGVVLNTQNPGTTLRTQTVMLSLTSTPKGATVLVDRNNMGVTPIMNTPVTSSNARELRVELKGYRPFVKTMPFLSNRKLSVALQKLLPPVTNAKPGNITLTFRGTSWVRIKDKTGKVLYEGIPTQGSSQAYTGPITVRAGQPDQISSTINGVTKASIGSAEAATITLP